ncbi:hypothetical protein CACET_c31840 [Clostridium aceticum]|uniref:Uncharacterized protein n=1 Tax=Clostridium aceticum TaxID=84022 RepID=A0A0D8I745_9CLOT|nr:hypothetical protein [Clostridium aceticum]AKL96628.1 hypothetical protein CACET_c31840 [Clostridium aceticum]KJF26068.1 hypothetical protein TZ02_15210 [Clostridium aceticum]
MKAKVTRNFRDKNTKKLHRAGEEITISEERYEEINSTSLGGFIEEIREETDPKVSKESEKNPEEEIKAKNNN